MRQISICLLLILALYSSMGYYVLFVYIQHAHYAQVQQQLAQTPAEQLQYLCLDTAEYAHIVWLKPHEFRYHKHLYDLKAQHTEGDCVYLSVKQDEQEEHSHQQFAGQNNSRSHHSKHFVQFLHLFQAHSLHRLVSFEPTHRVLPPIVTHYHFDYDPPIGETPSPPPKI